jgi:hemerythrin
MSGNDVEKNNRWFSKLETGIPGVDKQHKELFSKTGSLSLLISTGKGRDLAKSMIFFLEKYVLEHFNFEE